MTKATRRSRLVVSVCAVGCIFGSIPFVRGDDPKDSILTLTKVFLDTSAKREAREAALETALGLARNKQKPGHAKEFKPALITLLSGDLKANMANPAYTRFLGLALKAMGVYDAPDPEIAPLAKPYLSPECPDAVRIEAVRALGTFGTAGMYKELIAIVDDFAKAPAPPVATPGNPAPPPPPGGGGPHREPLLRLICIVATCDQTPTSDALPLLGGVVKQTRFPGARREACHELGEFATHRNPSEVRSQDLAAALLDACSLDEPDQNLACTAAEALWRFGNPEGYNLIVNRLDDKRKATKEVYASLCGAVHAGAKGFNDVPPARFNEFDPITRGAAIVALKQAWKKASTQPPGT